jgi:hypothetical protein
MRIFAAAILVALLGPPAFAESEAVRVAECLADLETVLDGAGYTHAVVLDPELAATSIVDATEALRDERSVDVAVLTDGTRVHAVAPFLDHRRARRLAVYAQERSDDVATRVCVFVGAVREDAKLRRAQRAWMGVVSALGFAVFAGLMLVLSRRGAVRQKAT